MVRLPTGKFYRTTFDLFANKSINLSRTDYGHIILTTHTKHLENHPKYLSLVEERTSLDLFIFSAPLEEQKKSYTLEEKNEH